MTTPQHINPSDLADAIGEYAQAGGDYHVPFGGRKGSSDGSREQGQHARAFFTTVKTAYVMGEGAWI